MWYTRPAMSTDLSSAAALAATLNPAVEPGWLERGARGTLVFTLFCVVLFLGNKFLPGRTVQGFKQPDGNSKSYKINGLLLYVLTQLALALAVRQGASPSWLIEHFWELFVGANVVSVAVTLVLYMQGSAQQKPEERGVGPVGVLRDLFMGTELNPTWWGVDLKMYFYHPSLIGLGLLNTSFAFEQIRLFGALTPQMWLYQGLWIAYLLSHFWYEAGMLSMWDIIAEKFGFMLVWGDLGFVPFFYCIAGWSILEQREAMSVPALLGIAAVHALGLWLFRGSNAQKHQYKLDPRKPIWGREPETVGGKLLVSGWWGVGRKLNYTGEITVYLSFALCAGFASLRPYALPLWLLSLLVHRASRDEARCREKYGPLWEEYCKRATFRMFPFLY